MAPMIDMVFLLLVFFMTVGTMARDLRPPAELAESTTASPSPDSQPVREIITLLREGDDVNLFLGASPMKEEALQAAIRGIHERHPGREWELRAGSDVPWRHLETWMRFGAELGVDTLQFTVFRP